MQTEETTEEAVETVKENELFKIHHERFAKQDQDLAACRRFIETQKSILEKFTGWNVRGWSNECVFDSYNQKPFDVARAFGETGWKRKANEYSCGSIDWRKEVDGMTVKIEGAENIKPTLREDVRLPESPESE